jgi:NADPH:quinone reductase-like Zn-dependent oxidoreductase
MARAVRFYETGGPEVLRIEEIKVPPPGKGEVQIRIHALGLNRAEVMFRAGQYVWKPQAHHRQDVPARADRRGAPVPGVEPAIRQDRGDRRIGMSGGEDVELP